MVICFQCDDDTKKRLDHLVRTGQYRDYAEVIVSAIKNETLLQQKLTHEGGAVVFDVRVDTESLQVNEVAAAEKIVPSPRKQKGIPSVFSASSVPKSAPKIAPIPPDTWGMRQEVPLDKWIFGQYNRLFPGKANCRALTNLLTGSPEGVLIEEAGLQIAKQAWDLRDYLAQIDERYDLDRDNSLCIAFPDNSGKSCLRYVNQFFCSMNSQGQLSGLLFDLKLVNRGEGPKSRLLLTEPGWCFARLNNPILDGVQTRPSGSLSDEEVDFLINHIVTSVPVENFAYRAILDAIQSGANTPETMDEALKKYLPRDSQRKLSKGFCASQRSGAVSRMADLRLLGRKREGLRVTYLVTERGKAFLGKM